MIDIEISIMQLGTNKWKYYNVYDLDSFNEAIDNFNKELNWMDGDYEIQLIESNISINEDYLYEFFKYIDENPNKEEDLLLLMKVKDFNEAVQDIEEEKIITLIQAENKLDAFIEYYEELGYPDSPEEFSNYVSWDKIMSDWEFGGLEIYDLGFSGKLSNIHRIPTFLNNFLFIN